MHVGAASDNRHPAQPAEQPWQRRHKGRFHVKSQGRRVSRLGKVVLVLEDLPQRRDDLVAQPQVLAHLLPAEVKGSEPGSERVAGESSEVAGVAKVRTEERRLLQGRSAGL